MINEKAEDWPGGKMRGKRDKGFNDSDSFNSDGEVMSTEKANRKVKKQKNKKAKAQKKEEKQQSK